MRTAIIAAVLALLALAAPVSAQERELIVTPELEQRVRRGLDFLAQQQTPDGCWPGQYGQLSGVVGLCVMSLLAHGEVPDEGRYGEVIRRGVRYIVETQAPNGLLCGRKEASAMYSHGFATLALAEVYGRMDYPQLGPALMKAVGLIVSTQNALGGWRYTVGAPDADTTVTGAQMMALRAAANAGIEVPYDAIQRGLEYYRKCFCPGGSFGYTDNVGPNAPRAGIGLLVLCLSGEYRSPMAKQTADWLMAHMNETERTYYMTYYCSQAMYQAGGKYWRQWNNRITARILSEQLSDGSWPPSLSGGGILETAMALLSVELNYNFLPIYQR